MFELVDVRACLSEDQGFSHIRSEDNLVRVMTLLFNGIMLDPVADIAVLVRVDDFSHSCVLINVIVVLCDDRTLMHHKSCDRPC